MRAPPPPDTPPAVKTLQRRFPLMGGEGELHLVGAYPADLQRAADAAIAEARRIEHRYSRYRPDSIVSRINAAAGSREPVVVDDETASLLHFAAQLHAQSQGRFDITSGILRQAWDFRKPAKPDDAQLQALCRRIGWQRVQWDGQAIRLPEAGMEIDFGGFGKEYAADRCAALLVEQGCQSGFVNLGGDLRVIGPPPGSPAFRLGIQHPRRPGETIASMELAQGALATSGDYERFIEVDGVRYCHILDARTGWPVRHWQSVSVVAPLCVAAGALATIAMLMGEAAPTWLDAQGADWLAVGPDGQLHGAGAAAASMSPHSTRRA